VKILSWNVNGLRAIQKKGFLPWFEAQRPDVLCLQEIKARPEQLDAVMLDLKGYRQIFNPARKPGYSGTAIYTRQKPDEVWTTIGDPRFDDEGRVTAVRFGELEILSAYFPNSREAGERLDFKIDFCTRLTRLLAKKAEAGRDIVLTGDYNIAHEEIDLARPHDNHESPGFFPRERQAMTDFLAAGFHDVFREKNPSLAGAYTWWSYRSAARKRNVGWRIDYATVNSRLRARVKKAWLLPEVDGSDHCPVGVELR